MNEAEYTQVWQVLAEQPRSVLWQLVHRMSLGLSERRDGPGRIIADVSFGRLEGSIESVHGPNMETILAKAIALGVDRRLAAIARSRAGIDVVTDAVMDGRLVYLLERLTLRATTPTDSGTETPADTKAGEHP